MVVGYPVTDNGTFCCIHNKPDISFDTSDFDVGFISSEDLILFVGVLIHERFYTDGCSFAVVGYALVGDENVMDVFQGLFCFLERKTKIDTICQAECHDIGIKFTES